jgi:tetratricopeptide (TPR) repeat protein
VDQLTGTYNLTNEGLSIDVSYLLNPFSLSLPKIYAVKNLWILALLCVSLFACSPSEEELLKVGLEKMDAQAWPEAVTYFDQLLEKNPTNATALNAKGVALFQQGKIQEAIPVFNSAIQADSTSYKAWFNRGNAKMELENYKEALADFNIATALDASQSDIYFNRGTALLNMEEYEDALLDFQTVLQSNPNQAEAHFRKAKAELGMNDPIHGLESLTNTVNLDPKNAEAYYLLGVTRMSALGQKNEGCADLKMALSLGYAEAQTWITDFCE